MVGHSLRFWAWWIGLGAVETFERIAISSRPVRVIPT